LPVRHHKPVAPCYTPDRIAIMQAAPDHHVCKDHPFGSLLNRYRHRRVTIDDVTPIGRFADPEWQTAQCLIADGGWPARSENVRPGIAERGKIEWFIVVHLVISPRPML